VKSLEERQEKRRCCGCCWCSNLFLKSSGVIYLFSLGLGEFLVIILLHVLLCFAMCEINVFSVT